MSTFLLINLEKLYYKNNKANFWPLNANIFVCKIDLQHKSLTELYPHCYYNHSLGDNSMELFKHTLLFHPSQFLCFVPSSRESSNLRWKPLIFGSFPLLLFLSFPLVFSTSFIHILGVHEPMSIYFPLIQTPKYFLMISLYHPLFTM